MGTITGAAIGLILYVFFGLLPTFRISSYLALLFLNKLTGRSSRTFVALVVVICVLTCAAFSFFLGAIIGSLFLLTLIPGSMAA